MSFTGQSKHERSKWAGDTVLSEIWTVVCQRLHWVLYDGCVLGRMAATICLVIHLHFRTIVITLHSLTFGDTVVRGEAMQKDDYSFPAPRERERNLFPFLNNICTILLYEHGTQFISFPSCKPPGGFLTVKRFGPNSLISWIYLVWKFPQQFPLALLLLPSLLFSRHDHTLNVISSVNLVLNLFSRGLCNQSLPWTVLG